MNNCYDPDQCFNRDCGECLILKNKAMKIYIASSWKNQHGVEMLTKLLRDQGHEVISWVENNYGEGHGANKPINFEEWVKTEKADNSFYFDTEGARNCDIFIYYGPAGKDAAAE